MGARSLAMSVSVCPSACVCLSVHDHLRNFTKFFAHVTCGCGSVLWRRSDMLRISGFVDDVIFAHKLTGCSMSPPGWGSEAHTNNAALCLARRNTHCRQRTLGATSCNQSLLGRSGRVEYLWHHACTQCPCVATTRKWRVLKVNPQVAKQGRSLQSTSAFASYSAFAGHRARL